MAKADNSTGKFIEEQLKSGKSVQQVVAMLVANRWQQTEAEQVVNQYAKVPNPPVQAGQPAPPPPNTTSQTGNAGTPAQSESVQYNMVMAPVESRVGFFLKIASIGLWFMVFFVAGTLAAIITAMTGDSTQIAETLVVTISISVAAVPTFIVANKKMENEIAKNKALVDDLFYKKATRSGLYASIVLASIAAVAAVYNLLGAAFLDSGSVEGFFIALAYLACFGGALYYYWRLHTRTRR